MNSKLSNLGKAINKSTQKSLLGGNPPEGNAQNCNVSCGTGYYGCCGFVWIAGYPVAHCVCAENSYGGGDCSQGGLGQSSCSL